LQTDHVAVRNMEAVTNVNMHIIAHCWSFMLFHPLHFLLPLTLWTVNCGLLRTMSWSTTWSHSRSLEMLRLNRTSITSFYWPVVTVSCKVYEIQYHYNFSILFPFNALDTSVRNQDSLGYSLLKIMQI